MKRKVMAEMVAESTPGPDLAQSYLHESWPLIVCMGAPLCPCPREKIDLNQRHDI
jgi:hypothetical protein